MTPEADTVAHNYDVTVKTFEQLQPVEIEGWRALCAGHEDYDSALFTPEFAEIIAGVRDDVRVIVAKDDGALKAVLPFHLRPNGFARPLGAPFSDYSAPILAADFSLSLHELLERANIGAYDAAGVPDPFEMLDRGSRADRDESAINSRLIRATDAGKSVLESQRTQHAKRFKNFRRLRNQIEREVGEVTLGWGRPDPAMLAKLLGFKREQYRDSGYVDLTSAEKARALLDAVAASEHAFMTTLCVGETLISGHFGVRVGDAFHPWIAAYNPAYSHFSPGNVLLMAILEQFEEIGLKSYDLANGHDHYKKYFANASRTAWPVFETGAGLPALEHKIKRAAWQLAGADSPTSPVGRLQRRLDQIAVSEFKLASRAKEFVYAVRVRSVPQKDRRDTAA